MTDTSFISLLTKASNSDSRIKSAFSIGFKGLDKPSMKIVSLVVMALIAFWIGFKDVGDLGLSLVDRVVMIPTSAICSYVLTA